MTCYDAQPARDVMSRENTPRAKKIARSAPPASTPSKPPAGYAKWLGELKSAILASRQRAAAAVSSELVMLYWRIGREILGRQE